MSGIDEVMAAHGSYNGHFTVGRVSLGALFLTSRLASFQGSWSSSQVFRIRDSFFG